MKALEESIPKSSAAVWGTEITTGLLCRPLTFLLDKQKTVSVNFTLRMPLIMRF